MFLGVRQLATIYCRKLVQAYVLVEMYQKKTQMLQTAPARMTTSRLDRERYRTIFKKKTIGFSLVG
jgi:hypothetical protein